MSEAEITVRRCAFCHDRVEVGDRSACARCLGLHHLECWREHGKCAACGATMVLTLEAEAAKAGKTIQDWIDALGARGDKYRRRLAARVLGERSSEAGIAVVALTRSLQDPDSWVRRWACKALGEVGARASSAVPALTSVQREDVHEKVRDAAAAALGLITAKKAG